MNSFLLSLAALLVLVLSAAFVGPHFVDWNDYRDVFEAQASRLVGRAVDVQGNVEVTLLPTPVMRFEQVRLADANGSFETPLAEAQSFTAWLSVPPLLRGAVEAREVDLERPVLNLRVADDGAGSWGDLGSADPALPIVPSNVALASVRIRDGLISIEQGDGAPLVLDKVNGDLSATSLDGPFKFEVGFEAQGEKWDLRLSTGRRQAETGTRLKGILHDAGWQQSYSFDGALDKFTGIPEFRGRLLARFAREGGQLLDETKQGPEAGQDAALEVKAAVDAGLVQARLSDIEATIRRNSTPHTINGRVDADWRNGLDVQAELTARWFDLDALIGASKPQPPAGALARLAKDLLERAAPLQQGRLQVSVDQAVLGGDVVKGLRLDVARETQGLKVAQLAGEAPGENFVQLSGALDLQDTQAFTGLLRIEGKRLSRLLRWAGAEVTGLAGTETGNYSVKTQISSGPGFLMLEQVEGDVLGTAFSGGLRYRSGDRPEFDLSFSSARLDLERLLGSEVTYRSLRSLILPESGVDPAQSDASDAGAASWLERADAKVDLNIGAVRLPRLGETSLKANLQLIDGNLVVEDVRMASDTSLDVRGQGRLASVARQPEGLLTLEVKAAEAAGMEGLARFLDLPEELMPEARIKALSPVDVTVKLESKGGGDRVLESVVEGSVGDSALQARLAFIGDLADFGAGDVDAEATVRNANGKTLLAQLFPRLRPSDLSRFKAAKGLFTVKARGVPEREMDAQTLIEAAGLRWSFEGKAGAPDASLDLTGATSLKIDSVAAGLGLMGLHLNPGEGRGGFDLTARLAKSGAAYDLTGLKGKIAGSDVQGKMRFDLGGAKPKLDAIWAVSETSLPHVLGLIVDWTGQAGTDAALAQAIGGPSTFWTDKTFNAELLDAADGQLVLTAQKLHLTEGLTVSDATVEAELRAGTLKLQTIKGGLFGGNFAAAGQIAKRGSGIGFTGRAAAKAVKLDVATAQQGGAPPLAQGTADFNLTVLGEGLSPHGLVAGLTGEGSLALGQGSIRGLSPAVLAPFVEVSRSGDPPSEQDLVKQVTTRLKGSVFAYTPVTVPLNVRNGTARFQRTALTGPEGTATVASYLELASLKLDSEWMLALGQPDSAEAVPEVTVVFSGPLSEFGDLRPDIDAQALERYITMRRLERDVERLEDLDVGGRRGADANAPPVPQPRVRVVPHGPNSTQSLPEVPRSEEARVTEPSAAVLPPPPVRSQRTPDRANAPAQEPVPSLPLRAGRSPQAASPPASPGAGSGAVVRAPLEPLPGAAPAPAAPGDPAASAAAQPREEVLPWLTETDTNIAAPDAAADGTQAEVPTVVAPRAPRQQPRRRQLAPWQAEVFGQPSN